MRRLFVTLFLCCLSALSAVGQMRYCLSYTDFREGNWQEMDSLDVTERSQASKFWTGGSDFKMETGNDSLDHVLKKKAFAILCGDTLLLNCRRIYFEERNFGKGYVIAHLFGGNKICFVSGIPGSRGAGSAAVLGGAIFGAIGAGVMGGIAAASNPKQEYCFLVGHERLDGKVDVQMIGDEYMQRFESDSPEFYAEYMSETKRKKRERASHIMPLLWKWSLIQ